MPSARARGKEIARFAVLRPYLLRFFFFRLGGFLLDTQDFCTFGAPPTSG
jgi:hypothetical protein